ncbi:hypothetical protein M409DRAFT_17247 [Zasmidium cellare ATCC 36951]|uniref:A-kinase anchor protein 7-like phosphoesterase domain-containing protein n=1 Tax=Zasmidium cellare ATCC 36951 TaxID=1080233 RepID=A0A6A6D298_ZASCE|nr:uncharacterized protein M409DRAFT_17247 [Zasmidium cellare ATCC 36951]KAF2173305.1 hypothetical protein M409DRAFT_17247 [Zasmidium cellare ATCC 36951]
MALLTAVQAIRPVGALHCTLGVMSLNNDQLSQATAFLQSLDVGSILAPSAGERDPTSDQATTTAPLAPMVVDLKGLESMHAPDKTSVIYSAPFDSSERLYPFCLAVQQLFKDKGFLVEDDRKLKLHATIVNTIYAKGKKLPMRRHGNPPAPKPPVSAGDSEQSSLAASNQAQQDDGSARGHGPNANTPLKLDARELLQKHKNFAWAENVTLDRLAICEMGAKKVTDSDGRVIAEQYNEVASIELPT